MVPDLSDMGASEFGYCVGFSGSFNVYFIFVKLRIKIVLFIWCIIRLCSLILVFIKIWLHKLDFGGVCVTGVYSFDAVSFEVGVLYIRMTLECDYNANYKDPRFRLFSSTGSWD